MSCTQGNRSTSKEDSTSTPFAGGKASDALQVDLEGASSTVPQLGVLPDGMVYDGLLHSLELAATFADLSAIDASEHPDGLNLIPDFPGKAKGTPHELLFWLGNDPEDSQQLHLVAVRWKDQRLYIQEVRRKKRCN